MFCSQVGEQVDHPFLDPKALQKGLRTLELGKAQYSLLKDLSICHHLLTVMALDQAIASHQDRQPPCEPPPSPSHKEARVSFLKYKCVMTPLCSLFKAHQQLLPAFGNSLSHASKVLPGLPAYPPGALGPHFPSIAAQAAAVSLQSPKATLFPTTGPCTRCFFCLECSSPSVT